MPSANLFSHATRGACSLELTGIGASGSMGTTSNRTWTIPSSSPLSEVGQYSFPVTAPPKKTKASAKRYKPKISKSPPQKKQQQGSSSLPSVRRSNHHVPKPRKPQAPLITPVEVSDTSGTDSKTPLGADSSFTSDASFERHSGTHEEVQSPVSSECNHATQEVANVGDNNDPLGNDNDPLGNILLPTSSEVPTTSTPAPVTSSTLSSFAISGQRALPLANIVDPLQNLDFSFSA
ncbi:hypothetical protein GH714_032877 [Hevea brasiliensis]|uniref:Uncharacterized protein n=1 Tax=Hevea brasiliensis TaxID=3981 RepID=A0A6A6K976_HEVBR|nr:hypothetical protein GH714_032877 [Hevea brasiliensis]